MTKRMNQTKTTIYRRHAGQCPIKDQPLNTANCECPLWIHGKIRGKFLRTSLDTRTLATAVSRQRDLEEGRGDDPASGPVLVTRKAGAETLEYAAIEYLKTTKKLATSTQKLYAAAVNEFCEWAAKQELETLKQVESGHIRQYFDANTTWNKNSAQGRLTHLRVFFNWCCRTKHWIAFPPTEDRTLNQRGKSTGSSSSRVPMTPAQITQVLAAVERLPKAQRDRGRALIYLLLYTGMRISDATFCERSYLTAEGNMDYYVIKTRRPISLPPELQRPAIDALAKLPPSRTYFFQPDRADDYREARKALRDGLEFSTLMGDYTKKVREATALVLKVLDLAGIDGACHKFRDTFAINMLVGGADIFTVSQTLGHSDVKITQKHYMKLVPGYRERMSKSTRVLAYEFPLAS